MNCHRAALGSLLFQPFIIAGVLLSSSPECPAQANSWNSPANGHWEDSSWSLGIRPAAGQSIFITNAVSKAVGIFPTTPVNFPGTMTVSNLTVSGPPGTLNTLLLNFAGTAAPLNVLSNCTIGINSSLVNFSSALRVGINGGDLTISNANFIQEGGVTVVTNGIFWVEEGSAAVTNATVLFATANVIFGSDFVQSGGSMNGSNIIISTSTFELHGGLLSGNMTVGNFGSGTFREYGGQVASAQLGVIDGSFSQYSGAVSNQNLQVGGFNSGLAGHYSLYDGVVTSGNVLIDNGSFYQSNGIHTVSGTLGIAGFFDDYGPVFFSNYTMQNGFLNCGSISQGVFGSFSQINGTNNVTGDLSLNETSYSLSGGMLATSNTVIGPGALVAIDAFLPTDFLQSGGLHTVSNTLACAGHYHLDAGTLVVPAVVLHGILDLGASPLAAISNAAAFELGGTINLRSSTQHLAAMVLSGNSVINFGTGNSKLRFANSSAKAWTNGMTLTVSNWNGSAVGGGADQLLFGSNGSALTLAQLEEIRFVNPSGFSAGTWAASILPTGEIVPTIHPPLVALQSGSNFVVQWTAGNYVLQAATNINGPFVDVPVPSPYTNNMMQFPERFFRLRR